MRPILAICLCCLLASCSGFRVGALKYAIPAADGPPIVAYDLVKAKQERPPAHPRGVFCYVQGSEYESTLSKIGMLASVVIFGGRAILVEKRGCDADSVDSATAIRFDDKKTRVQDYCTVLDTLLAEVPADVPVVLVGASEGGDIAAAVAAARPRVSHLIMISAGGGMSQAAEFRHFVRQKPGYLGFQTVAALDSTLDVVINSPDSLMMWAGHPAKRWKTYLQDSSLTYLQGLKIPILMVHGDADESVPVESSRRLFQQLSDMGHTNVSYVEYPYLDHSLLDVRDQKSRYPYLEVDIVKWLEKHQLVSHLEASTFINRVKKNHKDIF